MLQDIVEVARQHELIIFADEIYDKTLYDGETHTSIASLADDVLCVTFNGLSKNYRSCGYRAGWMVVSLEVVGRLLHLVLVEHVAIGDAAERTVGPDDVVHALDVLQVHREALEPVGDLARTPACNRAPPTCWK